MDHATGWGRCPEARNCLGSLHRGDGPQSWRGRLRSIKGIGPVRPASRLRSSGGAANAELKEQGQRDLEGGLASSPLGAETRPVRAVIVEFSARTPEGGNYRKGTRAKSVLTKAGPVQIDAPKIREVTARQVVTDPGRVGSDARACIR